jgi:hypothetical protein
MTRRAELKIHSDYLFFSRAVEITARGMWGGLPNADRPRKFDGLKIPRATVGHRRIKAGQVLTSAIEAGSLSVYLLPEGKAEPMTRVGKELVRRLIKPNGCLSDHPYRTSLKTVDGDTKLLRKLLHGSFVVKTNEFIKWYERDRAKGGWNSQSEKVLKRNERGRPSKQTSLLESRLIELVRSGLWSAGEGGRALRDALIARGHTEIPSEKTLLRLVDRLELQTRHSGLRRKRRRRRPPKTQTLTPAVAAPRKA